MITHPGVRMLQYQRGSHLSSPGTLLIKSASRVALSEIKVSLLSAFYSLNKSLLSLYYIKNNIVLSLLRIKERMEEKYLGIGANFRMKVVLTRALEDTQAFSTQELREDTAGTESSVRMGKEAKHMVLGSTSYQSSVGTEETQSLGELYPWWQLGTGTRIQIPN